MNLLFFKKKGGKSVSGGDLDRSDKEERLAFKPRSSGPFKPASASASRPSTTIIRDHQMAHSAHTATVEEEQQSELQVTEVKVTLDSVLDCVPSEFLLPNSQTASMTAPVILPVHVVLPQLAKGRITMPLRDLISLLPQEILVAPLPTVPDRSVDLSLEKIVPQLPPQFFSSRSDQEFMPIEASFFPTPFGVDPLASQPPTVATTTTVPEHKVEVLESLPQNVAPMIEEHEEEEDSESFDETAALAPTVEEKSPAPSDFTPTHEEIEEPTPITEKMVAEPVNETAATASDAAVVPAPQATIGHESVEEKIAVEHEVSLNDKPLSPVEQTQFLIDINRCSAEELRRIPGVGPALALRIIAFREARGQITDINQLREVPGVGNKTFRRIIGASPSARGKIVRLVNHLLEVPQDRDLTLQEIVKLTAELPGVAGCIMAMEDGLFVTGHLPPPLDNQTVSAFGPQLFRRVSRYCRELQVGRVSRFSLFTDQYPVSIFHAGRIYLIVIHSPNRFSKSLLRRCERIAQEINYMCTERVTV